NTFVIDSRIYDKMHAKVKPRHRPTFLKIVEDEAVHKKVDWKRCCSYLETINEQEYNYGIDKKIVNQWHQILTLFFRSSPGSVLALLSVSNVDQKHLSPQDAQIWVNELEEKINMPLMHDYIDDMIKHFEKLLSSAPIQ
ncbi:MAG: hypothetical protein KDK72_02525, partial [Chlamydiia bacterium]|nr:hypothetical protein [Chlamydiia bacterium]